MIISNICRDSRGSLYFGKMHSVLFGREIDVVLHGNDGDYLDYAERCAAYFNSIPEGLLAELKKYSLRYCRDMLTYGDPASYVVPKDVSEKSVMNYARVNCLMIEKPKDSGVIAFSVEFSCDWEREHGMEWTIRDGKALYVGDFMGISPWYADSVYKKQCRSYVYDDFYL